MPQLICPDCGGIVGAKGATEDGFPCTCFKDSGSAPKPGMVTATSVPDLSPAAMSPTGEVQKICITCGMDVTHKGRVKDSRGYMCVACSKKEAEATKLKGVRCADCGRKVPEAGLFEYAGLKICQRCKDDRVAKAKHEKKFSGVADKTYKENAKRQILIMAGILGVLLLIIVLHYFKLLGSMF
jgi:hypothetical protein